MRLGRIEVSKQNIVFMWESMAVLFMVIVGSLLHFAFEWSGRSRFVGIFSAVNESVWEHLKLGFWSLVFYSLIEYGFIQDRVNNFLVGKAIGLLALDLFIVAVFYSYTALIGRHIVAVDIGIYVTGCLICQVISYRFLTVPTFRREWQVLCGLLLMALMVIKGIFTFWPPRLPLFRDSLTGGYGVYGESSQREQ